ncbi:MAG: ribulose-phosphate 3-epimerase [Pirellulaceae bacterium]|jgi:ribulose-phosphate 3-epimerase
MSRRHHLQKMRDSAPLILPSLLLCDFSNLQREVAALSAAGIQVLHLDVMDGHFVPNMSYGMPIVQACRKLTDMILDVHLMVTKPERYIDQFFEAGADVITIHVEATDEPAAALQKIRDLGAGAGLALNPDTDVSAIEPLLPLCDLVLPMSVNAGFGGQKFNPIALDKIRHLREIAPHVLLEMDGGVNETTIASCTAAGAELLVVGSAIFKKNDYNMAIQGLLELATK